MLGCCSGAGSSEISAARALGADCFITGEVKHHHALDAVDAGMCILEAGHFETENPACEVMANALQMACDELKYNVTVFCSKGNPFGR
jgi:putative NIF3 family GTP cyclohydrolase 1 type 2